MSANRSSEEIARQMWGRFDNSKDTEGTRHQTMRDARMKELAAEDKHRSNRDRGARMTDITGASDDMGENDSLGG
jgi:hypothetical protein